METLPPVLPSLHEELLIYLKPENLPVHLHEYNKELLQNESDNDFQHLFHVNDICVSTEFKEIQEYDFNEDKELIEVIMAYSSENSSETMLMTRNISNGSNGFDTINYPFLPAGFPTPEPTVHEEENELSTDYFQIPPGFQTGLSSKSRHRHNFGPSTYEDKNLITYIVSSKNRSKIRASTLLDSAKLERDTESDEDESIKNLIDSVINNVDVLNISKVKMPTTHKMEWAISLNIKENVNLDDIIMKKAIEFPFALDIFQRQAILKLENNKDVFIAAHTSAGKTVVAEYAVALSKTRGTRSIYTSPIKALSNQKYHDFRNTFENVGLITGDYQINTTALCLVMTTEILYSMLYRGSDLIRDLEFVIFDEIHYINDEERGHIWEECIILMPEHVTIIMLSATVPNPMEFANWIGQTRQRIVYVITTSHRPVPLEHYFYVGYNKTSVNNHYLLVDKIGTYYQNGYLKAKNDVNPNTKKSPRLDQQSWLTLIEHLKSTDSLPVVIFTFSRDRCDLYAQMVINSNITTKEEKEVIKKSFIKYTEFIKVADRDLPQIKMIKNLLMNGIGSHHSGILPILKEIIELMFKYGYIKVLFATETFAMGVNMPARSVVFDNIKKFDGRELRLLKTAEYVQMAGRAGRRGLDTAGKVFIRIPPYYKFNESEMMIQNMILGQPQKLESKFRLTYKMLLSVLRVESMTVEFMMERSYGERDHVKTMKAAKETLKKLEMQLKNDCAQGTYDSEVLIFSEVAQEFVMLWNKLQPKILLYPKCIKLLVPGRVLLVNYLHPQNKMAILISAKKQLYKVLVLEDENEEQIKLHMNKSDPEKDKKSSDWFLILGLASKTYHPLGIGCHKIIEISAESILKIAKKVIKIDDELVLKDWAQRQIPRFSKDPPGKACSHAITELVYLHKFIAEGNQLDYYDPQTDFELNSFKLDVELNLLYENYEKIKSMVHVTEMINFEQQLSRAYNQKKLEHAIILLKHQQSMKSLSLYSDYENRLCLLKEFGYINDQNRLNLKGKVACRLNMNVILVTELIFRNALEKLTTPEIAAVLSICSIESKCVEYDTDLPEHLLKLCQFVSELYWEISLREKEYNITADDTINFALVKVIYEWARNKSFLEIIKMTDAKEGVIIRAIQRLNELIRNIHDTAVIIGDSALSVKMEDASRAIMRGIVFTQSLYTQLDKEEA